MFLRIGWYWPFVNMVNNIRDPLKENKLLTNLAASNFSRRTLMEML
jgi:hypothetical protein